MPPAPYAQTFKNTIEHRIFQNYLFAGAFKAANGLGPQFPEGYYPDFNWDGYDSDEDPYGDGWVNPYSYSNLVRKRPPPYVPLQPQPQPQPAPSSPLPPNYDNAEMLRRLNAIARGKFSCLELVNCEVFIRYRNEHKRVQCGLRGSYGKVAYNIALDAPTNGLIYSATTDAQPFKLMGRGRTHHVTWWEESDGPRQRDLFSFKPLADIKALHIHRYGGANWGPEHAGWCGNAPPGTMNSLHGLDINLLWSTAVLYWELGTTGVKPWDTGMASICKDPEIVSDRLRAITPGATQVAALKKAQPSNEEPLADRAVRRDVCKEPQQVKKAASSSQPPMPDPRPNPAERAVSKPSIGHPYLTQREGVDSLVPSTPALFGFGFPVPVQLPPAFLHPGVADSLQQLLQLQMAAGFPTEQGNGLSHLQGQNSHRQNQQGKGTKRNRSELQQDDGSELSQDQGSQARIDDYNFWGTGHPPEGPQPPPPPPPPVFR